MLSCVRTAGKPAIKETWAMDFAQDQPGKPPDNSFKFSMACSEAVSEHALVLSLDDGRQKIEDWRRDYNEVRPLSAIANKAPLSLLNGSSPTA